MNVEQHIEPFGLKRPFISTSRYFTPTSREFRTEICFYFLGGKVVISTDGSQNIAAALPQGLFSEAQVFSRSIGSYDRAHICVTELAPDFSPPADYTLVTLRQLFGKIDDDMFILAGRAIQLIHWQQEHRFCGRCGQPMESHPQDNLNLCPACGFTSFPRLSPAVIMSVTDKDRILLGRAPHFAPGIYSTLAGFVEPGETLEEAVRREVQEEVGIRVKNVRYMGSQPWPFPHSIMIGFSAEYDSGEIDLDPEELEDARWFSIDKLPPLPSQITIARFLIDSFIASRRPMNHA